MPLCSLVCPLPRSCRDVPDAAWLALGISRLLENEPSVQKAAGSALTVPGRSSCIEELASPRRLLLCLAAREALARLMTRT